MKNETKSVFISAQLRNTDSVPHSPYLLFLTSDKTIYVLVTLFSTQKGFINISLQPRVLSSVNSVGSRRLVVG